MRVRSADVILRFPLWAKVWSLLALNFAFLAALGAGWFFARGEAGWHTLVQGPLGDRVAALADRLSSPLWDAAPSDRDDLLVNEGAVRGVTLSWWRNDGERIAGSTLILPTAVADELARGSAPPGPGPHVPAEAAPGPEPRRGAAAETNRTGRFLVVADGTYWLGLRLHPSPEAFASPGPPPRTTLLISTSSALRLAWLLGLHAWIGIAGLALGISVLFWLPFVRSLTRRLAALTAATEQIAEGRLDTRTVNGPDEIGRLGASINRMAGRLQSHADAQRTFLGDVAHELGSPLGRLQVAIEILEARASPETAPAIADVREEIEQMAALVSELLAFTRAGMRAPAASLTKVDLEPLIAEVVVREDGDRRVAVELPPGIAVRANEPLLRRALGNLVRNALRYGGDPIVVRAKASTTGCVIRVEDHGPGVPEAVLPRLGEPFFRPETARSRETGGVGLGLTIVRSAIAACGGEARFLNRLPHGFAAEIHLPAAAATVPGDGKP